MRAKPLGSRRQAISAAAKATTSTGSSKSVLSKKRILRIFCLI
jgi:hypothetical protein